METRVHEGDLPDSFRAGDSIAIDCEAMGLRHGRDRLCLVQLSVGDGSVDLVRVPPSSPDSPNLTRILADAGIEKIFHFARFDIAALMNAYGVMTQPVYCTRTASIFARTFADRHSLKDLCKELLGVKVDKEEQQSDWGSPTLTEEQIRYAANDVLYLHRLRDILSEMLQREDRLEIAQNCFRFLPWRARIDLAGWQDVDVFAHNS